MAQHCLAAAIKFIYNLEMKVKCPFCDLPEELITASNELAVAIRDGFPVSEGHTLVIPKRHVADWFETTREEQAAIMDLLTICKDNLQPQKQMTCKSSTNGGMPSCQNAALPAGFNVGINCGKVAGQTVMHLHVHLIPRYEGDQVDPRGGVRLIFPDKARYWDD